MGSEKMKIVFVANYMSHHQLFLSEELCKRADYTFVAMSKIDEERLQLGYKDMNKLYDFVLCAYDSEEKMAQALKLILEADVVIWGSAHYEYVESRLNQNKLTFKYSERMFKKGKYSLLKPSSRASYERLFGQHRNRNFYLLAASAYAAEDFRVLHSFPDKAFKWGYFTEVKKYNIDELIQKKQKASLLWAGRLIPYKHPESVIEVAKRLKKDGACFELTIIGTGCLEEKLKKKIARENLQDCVKMTGAMSPDKVRGYMDNSEVFIFTSDRGEGWGAVLNEAMNSGCAVVASHCIGSVPFLVRHGENGLIYKDGSLKDLYNKVKLLLENAEKRKNIAKNAYETMNSLWSPEIAAERLVEMSQRILDNKEIVPFSDGPCSVAKPIDERTFYKELGENNK